MVKTGLQHLLADHEPWVKGQRLGLVTHPAAVLPDLTHAIDALLQAGLRLTALFSAEHGLAGTANEAVPHSRDIHSGLPVFSLYGENLQPTPDMLENVDLLLFDLQDVGARFFTYLSTLYYTLRGAAQAGKPVLVLDRPNPINGAQVEGPVLQPGFESFVGIAPLPIRHGLTLGEAARWLNEQCQLGADLRVLPLVGWRRGMWFDETGLPWVPPSPAMPHLAAATVYPGTCLLEGTNLSEGRGTYLPFELCGAPWIDAASLAAHLNALCLEGVRFRPAVFEPRGSKFAGETCQGVQLHVLKRDAFQPVRTALHLLASIQTLYSGRLSWNDTFDRLAGTDRLRMAIFAGISVDEMTAPWEAEEEHFMEARDPHLIYR